jgi:hypothetical protein
MIGVRVRRPELEEEAEEVEEEGEGGIEPGGGGTITALLVVGGRRGGVKKVLWSRAGGRLLRPSADEEGEEGEEGVSAWTTIVGVGGCMSPWVGREETGAPTLEGEDDGVWGNIGGEGKEEEEEQLYEYIYIYTP